MNSISFVDLILFLLKHKTSVKKSLTTVFSYYTARLLKGESVIIQTEHIYDTNWDHVATTECLMYVKEMKGA